MALSSPTTFNSLLRPNHFSLQTKKMKIKIKVGTDQHHFQVNATRSPPTPRFLHRPNFFGRIGRLSSGLLTMPTVNLLRHVDSMKTMPSGADAIPRLNAMILGESLASEEHDLFYSSDHFAQQALVSSPKQYLEMYKRSIEDPAGFWSDIASEFYWKQKWGNEVCSENLDVRKGNIKIEWFKGGATNIFYNCVDCHVESGNGDRVAILWEGNEPGIDGSLTYKQLLERVCQLANYLKDVGVRKGNAFIIYLPMLMELPITMLACARIGDVHSVVFSGFSAESIAQRIVYCKPKVVITCNAVRRGSKVIYLKDIVDAALVESTRNGISLEAVSLSYNNFHGHIPSSFGNLTTLNMLFLGGNGMEGCREWKSSLILGEYNT